MQITKHLVSYYCILFLRVEIHSLVQNQDCDICDHDVFGFGSGKQIVQLEHIQGSLISSAGFADQTGRQSAGRTGTPGNRSGNRRQYGKAERSERRSAENERKVEDIEKIVLEQNYYPQNEDYYDI